MKIAIVAPSGVPFIWGGAENIWKGMWLALNEQKDITAELIKLPSPEHDFWSIMHSYQAFAELNLDHFDMVISTKYPAWMISHPRHVLFMQHTLRGLYDTYPSHLNKSIEHIAQKAPDLYRLLNTEYANRNTLQDCFDELKRLKSLSILSKADTALPSPLLRAIVHFFDRIALAPGQIMRYTAIAHEVANRAEYFPTGIKPEVLYHPSSLNQDGFTANKEAAIFTASRLDQPKRIDLLIKAYIQSRVTIPLRIAGSGPQQAELENIIAGNKNIQLLGHISEQQLAQEYANALFVPFIPLHEDFGLITYEAMKAGKAVLSCTDSGGVTELVKHQENGLLVAPSIPALASAIQQLCASPNLCAQLGQAAYSRIQSISWSQLAKELLNINKQFQPRIMVLNTFTIYPVMSGGQARLYHLYAELSKLGFFIEILNLDFNTSKVQSHYLADNFVEVKIPVSEAFRIKLNTEEKRLGISCVDWLAAQHPELLCEWQAEIKRRASWASHIICSHPYAYPVMIKAGIKQWLYEAHNVEADLKAQIYKQHPKETAQIKEIESACAKGAQAIICCSNDDAFRLGALYRIPSDKFNVIANGADTQNIDYLNSTDRSQIREQLGLPSSNRIALFMGSHHGPNLEAVEQILISAAKDKSIQYIILGSVADAFKEIKTPANVRFLGQVSQQEKQLWLKIASIALNPMLSGSGSNLKLIEYAAAGLPIISTQFGVRGTEFKAGVHYLLAETNQAVDISNQTLSLKNEDIDTMTSQAYNYIKHNFSWQSLAQTYANNLKTNSIKEQKNLNQQELELL
ncbi:glycosyltransferase family 4 protein [Iodobacter sp. CM08]|uniref:glycosyltransferase family 4 protein n=1 Tax=Iodobacter sp. CM08 TaxID=3085902 RepID=UPI002981197F|nr:glycosyltransferase family 4 protein [Iodobacter sp. CM08]MDW5416966.1 glycosyltransferase family 4 protein [Iodobacter sp. CM08]